MINKIVAVLDLTKMAKDSFYVYDYVKKSGSFKNTQGVLQSLAEFRNGKSMPKEFFGRLISLEANHSIIVDADALKISKVASNFGTVEPWKLVNINGQEVFVSQKTGCEVEEEIKASAALRKKASLNITATNTQWEEVSPDNFAGSFGHAKATVTRTEDGNWQCSIDMSLTGRDNFSWTEEGIMEAQEVQDLVSGKMVAEISQLYTHAEENLEQTITAEPEVETALKAGDRVQFNNTADADVQGLVGTLIELKNDGQHIQDSAEVIIDGQPHAYLAELTSLTKVQASIKHTYKLAFKTGNIIRRLAAIEAISNGLGLPQQNFYANPKDMGENLVVEVETEKSPTALIEEIVQFLDAKQHAYEAADFKCSHDYCDCGQELPGSSAPDMREEEFALIVPGKAAQLSTDLTVLKSIASQEKIYKIVAYNNQVVDQAPCEVKKEVVGEKTIEGTAFYISEDGTSATSELEQKVDQTSTNENVLLEKKEFKTYLPEMFKEARTIEATPVVKQVFILAQQSPVVKKIAYWGPDMMIFAMDDKTYMLEDGFATQADTNSFEQVVPQKEEIDELAEGLPVDNPGMEVPTYEVLDFARNLRLNEGLDIKTITDKIQEQWPDIGTERAIQLGLKAFNEANVERTKGIPVAPIQDKFPGAI